MAIKINQIIAPNQINQERFIFWFGKICLVLSAAITAALGDKYSKELPLPDFSALSEESSDQKPISKLALSSYSIISQRNIFGEKSQPAKTQNTAPKTQLSLRLVGTNVSSSQTPFAIIENITKKEQDVFELNQRIFDQAKLLEVSPDSVKIEANGRVEVLLLENSADSSSSPGITSDNSSQTDFNVPEQELTEALSNLPKLLSQARAVPYFRNGQSVGMRLFAIRQDSLYEKLGLKNGDIIKSVNNTGVGDPTQALKLFEQLKTERSIQVEVERDGQPSTLKYSIR